MLIATAADIERSVSLVLGVHQELASWRKFLNLEGRSLLAKGALLPLTVSLVVKVALGILRYRSTRLLSDGLPRDGF